MIDAEVQIFEQKLDKGKGSISILCGGFNAINPKLFMDDVVSNYVNGEIYNEFIEIFLDNPYVRVIITGINEIEFKEFDGKTHLLETLKKRLKSEENAKEK
ncbi:MAG: hypothetical protein IJK62_10505 [Bacteroidales bacterium]|nr:hypothetical protein [Bacteroidales bacterium]